ncbi:sulfatase-like hydrolase/transferase [Microbulbifer sp. SH-1]|uniref:LTA synthase family protein n=1 Tax=Microbulbifer sp. SH-1 TaxID=2681547 RepID=UPI0014084EF4|nr:sulfatase-like hydrolase/transferase [Microbulbifer sp. SH-1]QIL89351.1 sulfatase-like hydrolase/transferase [Microbulbifer sp. SH-1]
MTLLVRNSLACLLLLGLLWGFIVTSDPYLSLGSPFTAQLLNLLFPAAILFLVWSLIGRMAIGLLIAVLLVTVFHYAGKVKAEFLGESLVYADFSVVSSIVESPELVIGFVPLTFTVFLFAFLLTLILVSYFLSGVAKSSGLLRAFVALVGSGLLVFVGSYRAPSIIPDLGWEAFQQSGGAAKVGIIGNVLLGKMTQESIEIVPDIAMAEQFWAEPRVIAARTSLERLSVRLDFRPDIVMVQSESLFMPGKLCGMPETPVLPNISSLGSPRGGELEVPVFGGRTLQSEFESLSGVPISAFPHSMFAYYDLLKKNITAIPRVLAEQGYNTVAIHPNKGGFWNRNTAMGRLGFQTFLDINAFLSDRDESIRGHVSDLSLVKAVLSQLDSANGPTFVEAITMDNHGPWGAATGNTSESLPVPDMLNPEAAKIFTDYLARARDADSAYGYLIDALRRRERPTLVVFFGDHMPALPSVYKSLCFKNGLKPEEQLPPYRFWSNFSTIDLPEKTSSYLIPGLVFRSASLPMPDFFLANAVMGVVQADSEISAEEKLKIKQQYEQLSILNMTTGAEIDSSVRTIISRPEKIADTLKRFHVGGAAFSSDSVVKLDSDMQFSTFRGAGGVRKISIRSYLDRAMLSSCAEHEVTDQAAAGISVKGGGREIYRAPMQRGAFRLATFSTAGLKDFKFEAYGLGENCPSVNIKIVQLQCDSPQCEQRQEDVDLSFEVEPRFHRDFFAGDLKSLKELYPEGASSSSGRREALDWLLGRVVYEEIGYGPFRVHPDHQIFMHPSESVSAKMKVDVSGSKSLTLTPRIDPLAAHCRVLNEPGREAGLVGLTIKLDGKNVFEGAIDRKFNELVTLSTESHQLLEIIVDKGNEVSWCDWFSVGVDRVNS